MKFGRTYELKVQGQNNVHVFKFPTTLQFDVTRTITSQLNPGSFAITNINEAARKDIYLDRSLGYAEYRSIQLSVGYVTQPTLPVVFKGNIKEAYSEKQGSNIITRIKAFDGGFAVANGFVAISKPKSWNFVDAVQAVMRTMPNVSVGTVTPQLVQHTRGIVLNGASWTQLQRLAAPTGSFAFIDKEVVNLLSNKGVVVNSGGILVIQSSTGLTNLPSRVGHNVMAQTILESRFDVGNLAILNSRLNAFLNGAYKILGFHHYGTISGVESGDALTDFTLIESDAPVNA